MDEGLVMSPMKDSYIVALDDALKALAEVDDATAVPGRTLSVALVALLDGWGLIVANGSFTPTERQLARGLQGGNFRKN